MPPNTVAAGDKGGFSSSQAEDVASAARVMGEEARVKQERRLADEKRARTKVKAAGIIMLIFGVFVAIQAGPAAFLYTQPSTWESQPGGHLIVEVAGHPNATVQFLYPDGTTTTGTTNSTGAVGLNATVASFTLRVTDGNLTAERLAIIPQATALVAPISFDEPNGTRVGFDPASAHWLWVPTAVALLVALGGIAAFRRNAQTLALTGAWAYLAGALYLLVSIFFNASGIIFAATAAGCLYFIHRNRSLIKPGWAFWRRA